MSECFFFQVYMYVYILVFVLCMSGLGWCLIFCLCLRRSLDVPYVCVALVIVAVLCCAVLCSVVLMCAFWLRPSLSFGTASCCSAYLCSPSLCCFRGLHAYDSLVRCKVMTVVVILE